MVGALDHAVSHAAVDAERAFLKRLEGGCQIPIAGYAHVQERRLTMTGLVAEPDGSALIQERIEGPIEEAARLGVALAETLLARGADGILNKLNCNQP
jgi:hydroxymethylbilane synthase